jgi:hypothetical protein
LFVKVHRSQRVRESFPVRVPSMGLSVGVAAVQKLRFFADLAV